MGEVIQGKFGGGKPSRHGTRLVSIAKLPADNQHARREQLALDVLFYAESIENRKYIDEAEKAGGRMTLYVFELLKGFELKGDNLQLRRKIIESKSLQELCVYLLDSDASMWAAHPHFYGAVFVEFDERVKEVKRLKAELS